MWWEHIGNKGKMKISFSPTPTLKEIKNWSTLTTCGAFLLGRHSFLFYLLENQHVHSQKPSCLGVIFISNHLQLDCYPTYKHGVLIWKKRKLIDGKREPTPHVATSPNANIYWLPMCGIVLFSWHKYTKVIRSTSLWNISCVTH
jgi:hypothetical protein